MPHSDMMTYDCEEVRRSLDVLDKVLSEFDDIGASDENVNDIDEPINYVDQNTNEPFHPPPIDRTLKPQPSPPALPKKEGKSQLMRRRNEIEQNETSSPDSLKRSTSETSSHEYQEINSVIGCSKRSKSLTRLNNETLFRPIKTNDKNINKSSNNNSNERNRGRSKVKEILTKSKSDVFSDPKLVKEKFQKRKIVQRRSRSSDRVAHQKKKHSPSVSRRLEKSGERYYEDQLPIDPRLLDQRLLNTIPLDPRLRYNIDPMMLREEMPYIPPFDTLDDAPYLAEDKIPFPHLLHNPNIPLRLPHPLQMPYYPEDIPPEMMDPNFPPLIPNGYMPIDPIDFNYHQYPYNLENIDPEFAARNGLCSPEYPFDIPLEYYGIDPRNYDIPNEKFAYPSHQLPPSYLDKTIPIHEMEGMWIAAQQEQIALNHLRNIQQMKIDQIRNGHGERMNGINDVHNLNRNSYHGNMPLDRSEKRKSLQRNKLRKSASHGCTTNESQSKEAVFRVGEAVNYHGEESDEIISPTNFSSGGKDSGFEEISPVEDLNNRDTKSPHPGTGGGFIVKGVFNDSSKMYIPAPPSPTPDYDEKAFDSDGGESDILQSSLYHEKTKQGLKNRRSLHKCDSLSDDSLQDKNEITKKEEKTKTLRTMIEEFHNGLPTPVPESYSDDSLDGSSAAPSRPSSIGIKSRRIMSMESLTSIDGSTTSFDYVKGGSSKSGAKKKQNTKRHSSYFSNSDDFMTEEEKPQNDKKTKKEKFNTIRNLIKEGLLEGLDETPPDFKPPPASNGTLEKNDSGVSSRASTTKTNDSSAKSTDSSFSENNVNKPTVIKKSKIKEPAPQPPADVTSRRNNGSPTNHSWLHKQKRQAPTPNQRLSNSKQEKKKEKITHVDEINSISQQSDESDQPRIDSYKPVDKNSKNTDKNSYFQNERNNTSHNHHSVDSRINHPVFSGPLLSSDTESSRITKTENKKNKGKDKQTPVTDTSPRSTFMEIIEKDARNKSRKKSIEINSSPLNDVVNKYSQNDTKSFKNSYTSSKIFQDTKQNNSSWSPKFGDDSSKSRFNIFKGFWRRNKYSFDKF